MNIFVIFSRRIFSLYNSIYGRKDNYWNVSLVENRNIIIHYYECVIMKLHLWDEIHGLGRGSREISPRGHDKLSRTKLLYTLYETPKKIFSFLYLHLSLNYLIIYPKVLDLLLTYPHCMCFLVLLHFKQEL